MCGCTFSPNPASSPARATMCPAVRSVIGAPRSLMNTHRASGPCSVRSRRSARSSSPSMGCADGLPPFLRQTCMVAVPKSMASHSSNTASPTRRAWRYMVRISVASRCPLRPKDRAAVISRSISGAVRYSRTRRRRFSTRRGGGDFAIFDGWDRLRGVRQSAARMM